MNTIRLSNGVLMPCMAIGTNWMSYDELKPIMRAGFEAGIRAIDTARDYGNEPIVGRVLKVLLHEMGIKREEVFLTTKIGNEQQIEGNIERQINISLRNLQTDYVDCWLMHWPYPQYYQKTWNLMEDVYESGKVRSIGVANFQVRHFNKLFSSNINLKPMVHQMEYHPLRTAVDVVELMKNSGISMQAYAPFCRFVPTLKDSIVLKDIASKYGKTIGQVVLRWHIQQGNVMPVFKSYNIQRFRENVNVFDFSLSEEEMQQIYSLNQDYKYHLESINCPGY